MILGKNCTRNCKFCNVTKAPVEKVNPEEPKNVANAVKELGLKYVVITSVTRDDLPDGGAGHFAKVIGCNMLTIGQYLPPSKEHLPVLEYVHPDTFDKYKKIALDLGFEFVASGPLVRSSYNANEATKLIVG